MPRSRQFDDFGQQGEWFAPKKIQETNSTELLHERNHLRTETSYMAQGRYLPVVQQHPYEYDPYDEWELRKFSWKKKYLSPRDVHWSQHHNLCLSLISGILSRAMAHSSLGTHWSFVLCSKVHLTNASNCFSKFLYGHCTGQEYVSTPYFLGSILYYSFISVFDYVLFVLITCSIYGSSLFECSSDKHDELFLQVPLCALVPNLFQSHIFCCLAYLFAFIYFGIRWSIILLVDANEFIL